MSESRFEWLGQAENDVLARLATEPCPQRQCDGTLNRGEYKDAPAVVCDACEVPAARLWSDDA
ncbi:hypothetical protein SAMN04487949_2968 [Halogranum gelatinilyticum]|uniref:Uncharacterized protein n=1 Tax=Halogranum gelatinilyticum TaxID=660521 RepID=A0A1G9XGK4_9EURY|nr:HVO_A0556 family zinc finger protein [Halogranum gelatinilyticum]SDM95433.1 hypothetical protein SAMN04487949_2968 [Halogranum gelatinilyticum]